MNVTNAADSALPGNRVTVPANYKEKTVEVYRFASVEEREKYVVLLWVSAPNGVFLRYVDVDGHQRFTNEIDTRPDNGVNSPRWVRVEGPLSKARQIHRPEPPWCRPARAGNSPNRGRPHGSDAAIAVLPPVPLLERTS